MFSCRREEIGKGPESRYYRTRKNGTEVAVTILTTSLAGKSSHFLVRKAIACLVSPLEPKRKLRLPSLMETGKPNLFS
jgi:hypothetical protein